MSRPTDKQIAYALRLMAQQGIPTNRMSIKHEAFGCPIPSMNQSVETWLSQLSRNDVTRMIDQLKQS